MQLHVTIMSPKQQLAGNCSLIHCNWSHLPAEFVHFFLVLFNGNALFSFKLKYLLLTSRLPCLIHPGIKRKLTWQEIIGWFPMHWMQVLATWCSLFFCSSFCYFPLIDLHIQFSLDLPHWFDHIPLVDIKIRFNAFIIWTM